MFRIGQSRDVHRFIKDGETKKGLVLGTVKISDEINVDAHSDGDCLVHAIVEAIIGALGLGDIGTLFPDDDARYKDISSKYFLKEVKKILDERKYDIINIDSTIHIEKPIIKPFVLEMKKNICEILNLSEELLNIKATRGEKIGYIGRCEGVEAECVVLLKKKESIIKKLCI